MTLSETKKLSKHICRLLKVHEIVYPIGRTPKGNLGIVFNVNNDEYDIMLDSIPLSTKNALEDENNIELKAMIEKYMFGEETHIVYKSPSVGMSTSIPEVETIATKTIQEPAPPTKNVNSKTKKSS